MISGLETIIAAFIAGALAIIGIYAKARRDGAKAERLGTENAAMRDRLEMDREATEIEREIGKLSDAEIKERLLARAKP